MPKLLRSVCPCLYSGCKTVPPVRNTESGMKTAGGPKGRITTCLTEHTAGVRKLTRATWCPCENDQRGKGALKRGSRRAREARQPSRPKWASNSTEEHEREHGAPESRGRRVADGNNSNPRRRAHSRAPLIPGCCHAARLPGTSGRRRRHGDSDVACRRASRELEPKKRELRSQARLH